MTRYPNREEIVDSVKVMMENGGRDALIESNPLWSTSLQGHVVDAGKLGIRGQVLPMSQALHVVKTAVVHFLLSLANRRELVVHTDGLWYYTGEGSPQRAPELPDLGRYVCGDGWKP